MTALRYAPVIAFRLPLQTTAQHPELRCTDVEHDAIQLTILKDSLPRFRLSAAFPQSALAVTLREDGTSQGFDLVRRGSYWESVEEIPRPYRFAVVIVLGHERHTHSYRTRFVEL